MSGSDGTWVRNITDFDGQLAARVNASGVILELRDLHGDIMATPTTSTTSSGPASTSTYTEFGTIENGTPGTCNWLGADQISSEALGGQMLMGARSCNSNTGRFSQVDPIFGGSANAYDYALQESNNNYDLTGTRCAGEGSVQAHSYRHHWVFALRLGNCLLTSGAVAWGSLYAFTYGLIAQQGVLGKIAIAVGSVLESRVVAYVAAAIAGTWIALTSYFYAACVLLPWTPSHGLSVTLTVDHTVARLPVYFYMSMEAIKTGPLMPSRRNGLLCR